MQSPHKRLNAHYFDKVETVKIRDSAYEISKRMEGKPDEIDERCK